MAYVPPLVQLRIERHPVLEGATDIWTVRLRIPHEENQDPTLVLEEFLRTFRTTLLQHYQTPDLRFHLRLGFHRFQPGPEGLYPQPRSFGSIPAANWRNPRAITPERIIQLLEEYEGADYRLSDIEFAFHVHNPYFLRAGAGRRRAGLPALPKHLARFKSLLYLPHIPQGPLCGLAALVVGLAPHPAARETLLLHPMELGQQAQQLGQTCDLPTHRALSPIDFAPFVRHHPSKRIVVLSRFMAPTPHGVHIGTEWVAPTEELGKEDPHTLYLFYDHMEKHYAYIQAIQTFATSFKTGDNHVWCHLCLSLQLRSAFPTHPCTQPRCKMCGLFTDNLAEHQRRTKKGPLLKCPCCHRQPYNETCYDLHVQHCRGYRTICVLCNQLDYPGHRCHHLRCTNCYTFYDTREGAHRCYIQKPYIKKKHKEAELVPESLLDDAADEDTVTETLEYYVFDMESMLLPVHVERMVGTQVVMVEGLQHQVNLICVEQLYTHQRWEFRSLEAFITFAMDPARAKTTFFAHNLRGYDGRLLYDALVHHLQEAPSSIIWCGAKINAMTLRQVQFRDSLLHIATALSSLPKMFGFDTGDDPCAKGYFPYLFNVPDNQHYIGPLPPPDQYDPDAMYPAKRLEFEAWYAEEKERVGEHYDFQASLLAYCYSDVHILTRALEIYREEAMELNGLDPLENITIASYAMRVYTSNHMPDHQLAVLTKEENTFAHRGLRGGRTDVRRMLYKAEKDHYAKYYDIQSLYPTVQYYDIMPVGVPTTQRWTVQHQPSRDFLMEMTGFIECDIHPTQYLHHPVLVAKGSNNKLCGTLDPIIKQVFTSVEIQCALQHGYEITHVYQTQSYTCSRDLFKSYVRTFLKLKTQSKKPSLPQDRWEAEIQPVLHDRFGMELDYEQCTDNPGRYALAKLMLNSVWGKFGQRIGFPVTESFTTVEKYERLLARERLQQVQIQGITQVSDKSLLVTFTVSDTAQQLAKVNVPVAAFVAAGGRLRLWKALHKLGPQVLYHDTDSIIYQHLPGKPDLEPGYFLGDWTDETHGQPIVEFIGLGPKSYAYKVQRRDGSVVVGALKCKGFRITSAASKTLHYTNLLKLIKGEIPTITAPQMTFSYNKKTGGIVTHTVQKKLRQTYDKGDVVEDVYWVLPFGWARWEGVVERMMREYIT